MYLWLSEKVVQWKFVARRLGLQQRDLEEIMHDCLGQGISEHCYQAFVKWEQMFAGSKDCSYLKLAEALQKSEGNRHLYVEFVKKFKEFEQPPP